MSIARSILTFWLAIVIVVGGITGIVMGTMAFLSLFMSVKTAGFIWCGVMLVGVVVFFSWLIYDDERGQT